MRRLDRQIAKRIRDRVLRFAETGQADIKRLQGHEQEWRLRVGDWRVRLTFDVHGGTMNVLRIHHRSEGYRR